MLTRRNLDRLNALTSRGLLAALVAAGLSLAMGVPDAFAQEAASGTVTIGTGQGEVSVPRNPETVIVYDLASLDTLDALGVGVDGVPAGFFPSYLDDYKGDDQSKVGSLFEPDFEAVNALQPDLIVTGGRSRDKTQALSKIAPTIDMSVDPEHYLESAIERIEALGAIFGKQDEAAKKVAALEASISDLKTKAKNAGKGLIILTTGSRTSAFGPGSRFGVLHTGFGIEPADAGLDTGNHGEAVSFEYIAETNPDWLFVIDRDAAIGRGSAASLLENPLVENTTAWKKGQVVYLDPANWYLAGSGLQSMQKNVDQIASALGKKGF